MYLDIETINRMKVLLTRAHRALSYPEDIPSHTRVRKDGVMCVEEAMEILQKQKIKL